MNFWRLRLIVVMMRIHQHMLTLQLHNSKISWSINGLQPCFLNSDEEDHDPEKCEHANTKRFISHGDVNTPRWLSNILLDDAADVISKDHPSYWRCHLESSTQSTKISTMKNQKATSYKDVIKDLNAMIHYLFSGVTSLRGRLVGIRLFQWRLGHPEYCNSIV